MMVRHGREEHPFPGQSRIGEDDDDEEEYPYPGQARKKRAFNAQSQVQRGYNAQRSQVRQMWKETLERYGVLSRSNRLDQELMQRTLTRLHAEGDLAAAEQLAAAAAGRVQSTRCANRAKQVRRFLPDAQPLNRGRPSLKQLETVSCERYDNMLPGLTGTRASILARSMLSSAIGTPDGGAICAECGRTGIPGDCDPDDEEFYCEDCWRAYEDYSGKKVPLLTDLGKPPPDLKPTPELQPPPAVMVPDDDGTDWQVSTLINYSIIRHRCPCSHQIRRRSSRCSRSCLATLCHPSVADLPCCRRRGTSERLHLGLGTVRAFRPVITGPGESLRSVQCDTCT